MSNKDMILEVEGKISALNPSDNIIRKNIKSLKSYGRSSYSSLTKFDGSYVQVGGGGVSCMLEFFNSENGKRLRAFHENPNKTRPDGTKLVFGAGEISLKSDEWFMASQVIEVFLSFLKGEPFPNFVKWRDAPGFDVIG